MTRYLVVAHQTAASRSLAETLKGLVADDSPAEFVLLVPATPVEELVIPDEGEAAEIASGRCRAAAEFLESQGVSVAKRHVGDASPLKAIGDELSRGGPAYDAIVISTFPAGCSRWLKANLVAETERAYGLPVIHVEVDAPAKIKPSYIRLARGAK